jgi:hypothetical protein
MKLKYNTECICTKCGNVSLEYNETKHYSIVQYVTECLECFQRKAINRKIKKLSHLKYIRGC